MFSAINDSEASQGASGAAATNVSRTWPDTSQTRAGGRL